MCLIMCHDQFILGPSSPAGCAPVTGPPAMESWLSWQIEHSWRTELWFSIFNMVPKYFIRIICRASITQTDRPFFLSALCNSHSLSPSLPLSPSDSLSFLSPTPSISLLTPFSVSLPLSLSLNLTLSPSLSLLLTLPLPHSLHFIGQQNNISYIMDR